MASEALIEKWEQYKRAYSSFKNAYLAAKTDKNAEKMNESRDMIEQVLTAMGMVVDVAFRNEQERDIVFGKEVAYAAIEYDNDAVYLFTGGNLAVLEDYAQKHKKEYMYIELYYQILLLMAPDYLDAFCLYIERERMRADRFYEPRRRTLKRVVDALQALEDDELDRLFIHMPARVGKTQITTFYTAWHCSRDTEASNLYITYKEGLGGAFIDGVEEIFTDPTYSYKEVFPKVQIISTDAKNNKLDLGKDRRRRKKYKSLSGKGLESGLNGEYDASGVMILDDILEGVQDVLSTDVLERKRTIYQNNALPRKKENCKMIYMGTIWATNDIYMKEREFLETDPSAADIRYEVIKIPALDPVTDESNFEYEYGVGFSTDYYRRLRAQFEMNADLAGWWCQAQQEPIDRQGAIFEPQSMKYYKTLPEGEPIKVIAHCDVALGGADFLSFPVAYYYEDEEGDLEGYVEAVVFDNSEKHITLPQVVGMIKKHQIKNVHFEANQGGEGYKDEVRRLIKEDKEYKIPCNITSDWAPVTKRKDQRIWDCAQDIRELNFKEPQLQDKQYRMFMQNLFSFTMNKRSKRVHDDAPDSLAGLVEFDKSGSGVKQARIIKNPF